MIKQLNKVVAAILFAALVLSGCTSSKPASEQSSNAGETEKPASQTAQPNAGESQEKVLDYAIGGEAEKLDPHWANTVNETDVITPIFNGLVRFPPGTIDVEHIEGDLAEKWESNSDGTVWTFNLKKGVKWQGGYGELTSADVKWSFERVMNPNTGSPWKSDYDNVKSIEAPDPYTVVFNLKQPDPAFLLKVINYHGGNIVKKEAIEAAGDGFMTKPVGTGPYMLEEYKSNDRIVLAANPDYFRGKPKMDKIVFHIMKDPTAVEVAMDKGEIDLAGGVADKLWLEKRKANQDLAFDLPTPRLFWALYLNTSKKPFDDIRVRQAIEYAIDAKTLVEQLFGNEIGTIPTGPIAGGYFGSNDIELYPYDPQKAKELLAEAGYPNGLKLPTQYISSLTDYSDKMLYVQDQLKQVGIDMPLQEVDHATYHANVRKDLNQIVLYGYVRTPHADVPLTQFFYGASTVGKPTAVTNFIHYDKADKLIEQARTEMDAEKAKNLYAQIEKQIMDDAVVVPLAEVATVLVRRKEVDLGYVDDNLEGAMIYGYPINENTTVNE